MSSDNAATLVDVFVEAMVTAVVVVVAATAVAIAVASVWQGLSCGWLLCVEAPGAGGGPPLGRHFGKSRFKSAFSKIRLVIATARSYLSAGCPFCKRSRPDNNKHESECFGKKLFCYGPMLRHLTVMPRVNAEYPP